MRKTLLVVLAALSVCPPAAAAARKPNIIIFFMDDVGYGDLASYGAKDVATPNIDRLARQGARLTDCYAAASVCTPTRAALMTGRYQHRIGLESVIRPHQVDKGLPASVATFPRLLKDAGYATALFGKWHLGSRADFSPTRHGFDEFFGFRSAALDYYSHVNEAGKHDLFENDRPVKVDGYITDELARRTISFIDRHAAEPFFIDVAFNATHWPFHPPDRSSPPPLPKGENLAIVEKWAEEGTRADYVRMLERADRAIGEILAALDRHKLTGNTLVIFTSDNGGEWLSRMTPLSHRKGSLYEGGIRVPCILQWPGKLAAGTTSSQVAITMDLTATILAAAGANADRQLDAIDLVPLLAGGKTVERTLYWRSPFENNTEKALRSGKWKWITMRDIFPGQLFDMTKDPGEHNDLAAQHPELLRKFKQMHRAWEKEVAAK